MIRRTVLAVLGLLFAAFLVGCGGSGGAPTPSALNDQPQHSGPYQDIYSGTALDPARPRPSFTLTGTDGKPFAFGTRTAGHPTLLFFGYTNCPDVCPTTMADISNALRKVPVAVQRQVYVVFVSTDVKRDTADVLTRWLANFTGGHHATVIGLRGTQAQIDAAQASAHIFLAEDGGQTHSTRVLLFGPDDYARVSYLYSGASQDGADSSATQMAHDLPIVAGA